MGWFSQIPTGGFGLDRKASQEPHWWTGEGSYEKKKKVSRKISKSLAIVAASRV